MRVCVRACVRACASVCLSVVCVCVFVNVVTIFFCRLVNCMVVMCTNWSYALTTGRLVVVGKYP